MPAATAPPQLAWSVYLGNLIKLGAKLSSFILFHHPRKLVVLSERPGSDQLHVTSIANVLLKTHTLHMRY